MHVVWFLTVALEILGYRSLHWAPDKLDLSFINESIQFLHTNYIILKLPNYLSIGEPIQDVDCTE